MIELKDVRGDLVPIYLYNRDQLPVPRFVQLLINLTAFFSNYSLLARYYWKILHDPVKGEGVAIIGINNPHLEVRSVCQSDP